MLGDSSCISKYSFSIRNLLLVAELIINTAFAVTQVNSSSICTSSQWQCLNGIGCLLQSSKCNGVSECQDGSDESVALCGCLEGEFKCRDRCIPEMLRCDTRDDCDDGEDEQNCDTWHCPSSHYKCHNGFCIPTDKLCDFVDDCGDSSDEQDCHHRSCYKGEFHCANGECIRPGLICDRHNDCVDESDEKNCSEDNFAVCGSGKKIHRHFWCDGWPECKDNHADETICGPCSSNEFQCDDMQCISLGNVCDAQCDCTNCKDERDCEKYYTRHSGTANCAVDVSAPCIVRKHERSHDRCIAEEFLCDGFNHCHNGNQLGDESDCVKESQSCDDIKKGNQEFFRCQGEGRCLPASIQCDFKVDCLHADDELNCDFRVCGSGEWRCDSGECVPKAAVCNLAFECKDKSDEMRCEDVKCADDEVNCGTGNCLKKELWCDHYPDCPDNSDEMRCGPPRNCSSDEFACADGLQCIPEGGRCVLLRGRSNICADGSHLLNCQSFVCPPGMFKCREGSCLETSRKCDKVIDCLTTWDDEDFCPFKCSMDDTECVCYHLEADCSQLHLEKLPKIEIQINRYNFSGNNLSASLKTDFFKGRSNLVHIDLTNNNIKHLPRGVFASLWRLRILILKDNYISTIHEGAFVGLHNLRTLNLEGNNITFIGQLAFSGLSMLSTLDLSYQKLTVLAPKAFFGLRNLTTLTLSHNMLTELKEATFSGLQRLRELNIENNLLATAYHSTFTALPKLEKLVSDERRWCCLASFVHECLPPADEFSSCEDLMSSALLRVCIWVLGTIALVGNFFVIVWRSLYSSGNKLHSFLIVNLAIGDFLMGAYLIIIAGVDIYFRGIYATKEQSWRKSALCRFAGFCSTLSSELSVFTLTVITVDRLMVIKFPFGSRRFEGPGTQFVMALVWILVTLLAGLPLAPLDYFKNFYGRSGVCLALHITNEKPNGWEYAVFIFLVLNFVSFFIIAISYILMYTTAKSTQSAARITEESESTKRYNSASMAQRMTLLVVSDAACWMPIIVLGVISLLGIQVPPKIYAWVAVFVLPLNAAINPVLYTLSTAPVRKKLMGPLGFSSQRNYRSDLFRGSMSCSQWKSSMKSHVTMLENDGVTTETRLVTSNPQQETTKTKLMLTASPSRSRWDTSNPAILDSSPDIKRNSRRSLNSEKNELIALSELTNNCEVFPTSSSSQKKICDIDIRYD